METVTERIREHPEEFLAAYRDQRPIDASHGHFGVPAGAVAPAPPEGLRAERHRSPPRVRDSRAP